MRKRVLGRIFKRDKNERKALIKSLISALVLNDRIQTTEEKAKTVKSIAEKVITKAKKEGEKSHKFVDEFVTSQAYDKLVKDVAPRFSQRPGGYTRIIRLGKRVSDNASMVFLELVEKSKEVVKEVKPEVSKKLKVTKKEPKEKTAKKEVKPKAVKKKPSK